MLNVQLFEVPEEADEFDWNQDNFVRSALVSDEWRFTNGNPKPPVRMIKSPKLVKKQTALPSVLLNRALFIYILCTCSFLVL